MSVTNVTYNNGRIAMIFDLIFGLCAWDGRVWFPLSQMTDSDINLCRKLVDFDPVFPWKDELQEAKGVELHVPHNVKPTQKKIDVLLVAFTSAEDISANFAESVSYLRSRENDCKKLETELLEKEGRLGYVTWHMPVYFFSDEAVVLEDAYGKKWNFGSAAAAKAFILAKWW